MRWLLPVFVFVLSPLSVSAQPSPTRLWVDAVIIDGVHYPPTHDVYLPAGRPVTIAGWTMNCYTGQQPPLFTVHIDGFRESPFTLYSRLWRPDVQEAAPAICAGQPPEAVHLPSGPYLGFAVTIAPLTRGQHNILIRVVDPVAWPTSDTLFGTQYRNVAVIAR